MSRACSEYEGLYEACTDCFQDLDPAKDLPAHISSRFRRLMQRVGVRQDGDVAANVSARLRSMDSITVHSLIEEIKALAKILAVYDRTTPYRLSGSMAANGKSKKTVRSTRVYIVAIMPWPGA